MTKSIEEQTSKLDVLNNKIVEDYNLTTSIQPTIDSINKTLKAFGFTNFSIVQTSDNKYQIKRENGELANNTLSEGEVTFITFLYFMQLIKGGKTIQNAQSDRIVVIDDPISSLDSTILYVVSASIRDLIRTILKGSNIKQLILLTHNIFFFKEVTCIHSKRENSKTKYSYWTISKRSGNSIFSQRLDESPIKSSYELLWEDIKNWETTSAISLQNNMRRIFESYFMVFGGITETDVVNHFSSSEEKSTCNSLIGWINDGSHSIADDLHYVPGEEEKTKFLSVFEKIFDYMGHKGHYDMMMNKSVQN